MHCARRRHKRKQRMIQTVTAERLGRRVLLRDPKPRRLGSLFIPLRQAYVLTMPAILLGAAIFCWALGDDFALITGALVLTGVALFLFFDLLGRRGPLRLSTVFAGTLGLAYGLGTANTWFTLPRSDETLGDFMHIDNTYLAHAMAAVLVSTALMIYVGELVEKPIFGEDFELVFNYRSILLLTLGTAVLGASFLHGSTGFMGAAADAGPDLGHLGYLASLSEWLSGSLLAMAVCIALNVKGRFVRNYARILSVVLFLMVFPLGRRQLIYAVVLALVGLRLGRYKIPFSPLKKIVLLAALTGVIYMATLGFFFLRVAGYGLVRPTLLQRVEAAIKLFQDRDYSDIKKQFSQNVEQRTFILGFLGKLEGYTETMEGAHGEDLLENAQLAVPSLLYGGKDIFFTEEQLANRVFGSTFGDEANSILTTGAVDFGFWGILFYPLVIIAMLRIFLEIVAEYLPVFVSCFIIIASLNTMLEPEIATTSFFLIIRNGIIFGSVIWFVMSLPEFRIKNVGV
jgi:hypothetical protein